jgi:hypothetical protein
MLSKQHACSGLFKITVFVTMEKVLRPGEGDAAADGPGKIVEISPD